MITENSDESTASSGAAEAMSTTESAENDIIPEATVRAAAVTAATTVAPVASNKIATIKVTFTKAIRDIKRRVMPWGTAVATFGDGSTLSVDVTGGAKVPGYGISDAVRNYPVTRKGTSKYRNFKGDPMPYAVFYNRGEALHIGRLDVASHGCVHVADWAKMERINLGAVIGKTKVSVFYDPGVLDRVWNQHL